MEPKFVVHKLDVWDCGCLCCDKMRPMYHDVAHKQVCSILSSCNKQVNDLKDEIEIYKFEIWELEENRLKQFERIEELERLLYKKREIKDL